LAGTLAGLLVTWVTFAPCFLWVFLGAPYVEALRGARSLGAALSAVTAAVVGVLLHLPVLVRLPRILPAALPLPLPGLPPPPPSPSRRASMRRRPCSPRQRRSRSSASSWASSRRCSAVPLPGSCSASPSGSAVEEMPQEPACGSRSAV